MLASEVEHTTWYNPGAWVDSETENLEWMEITQEEAKVLPSSSWLLVRYTEWWRVPSGATGCDIGFALRKPDGTIKTDRNFDVRAGGAVRMLFGGGRGTFTYFKPK